MSELVARPVPEAIAPHLEDLHLCPDVSLYGVDVSAYPTHALIILADDVIVAEHLILSLLVVVQYRPLAN